MEQIINQEAAFLDGGAHRRRDMLPKIVRFFCWFFMAAAVISFICSMFGLWLGGSEFQSGTSRISVHVSSKDYLSFLLLILKGIVGYALWTERKWAIKLGIADAIISIVSWIYPVVMMVSAAQTTHIIIQLQILALIPYLVWLLNVQSRWTEGTHPSK